MKNDLRKRGTSLKPTIQIGKTGFSENIRNELRSQLENRELVKIRILNSMGPSSYWKEDLEKMVSEIKADLVEIKGSTALIYKRSSRKMDRS